MTDLETVADALGVDERALANSVDDDTTAADVLGRFPNADVEYGELVALVGAWLEGDAPDADEGDAPAPRGARDGPEGTDTDPPGESPPESDAPPEGVAREGSEPVTDPNSNGGDDHRRDTSDTGRKQTETHDGAGAADASEGAGTGTRDDSAGYRRACGTDDGGDGIPSWRALYDAARRRAGREPWEYVEEEYVREALDEHRLAHLLDTGALHGTNGWRHADMGGEVEPVTINDTSDGGSNRLCAAYCEFAMTTRCGLCGAPKAATAKAEYLVWNEGRSCAPGCDACREKALLNAEGQRMSIDEERKHMSAGGGCWAERSLVREPRRMTAVRRGGYTPRLFKYNRFDRTQQELSRKHRQKGEPLDSCPFCRLEHKPTVRRSRFHVCRTALQAVQLATGTASLTTGNETGHPTRRCRSRAATTPRYPF